MYSTTFSYILWLSHKTDDSFKFILIEIPLCGVGILLQHGKYLEAGVRRRRIRSVSEAGRDGIWLSKCTEVSPSILLAAISVVVIVDGLVTSVYCWGSYWFTTYYKRFTTAGPLCEWITLWGEWIPVLWWRLMYHTYTKLMVN